MNSAVNKQEARQLLALGIPSIIAQVAQSGLGVIDTIMAGQYSSKALAAIAIGNNLYYPPLILVIGMMLVLNPTIATLNGKQDLAGIRQTFHNGIYLALFVALPGMVLLNNFLPIMQMMDIEPQLSVLADAYLSAIAWGFPGLALFFVMRFTNEGLFANQVVMKVALSALPLNVLCNYWYMYGGFGLEAMGAEGVGWATTTVYYYMFAVLLIYTLTARRYRDIRFLADWRGPNINKLKEMLALGIPMSLSIGLEITLFAVIGLLIAVYGVTEMASHQIAVSISSLTYMMPLGLSMAMTARVGYHMGKGNPELSRRAGYIGLAMALAIMLVSATTLIAIPSVLVSLYTDDSAVLLLATQLLLFAALFQLSDGIQVASIGALRGLKDTKSPMYITAFSYWVIGFPAGYLFAETLGWGIEGYWVAMITSLSIAALLLTLRFIKLINQKVAQADITTQTPKEITP